MYQTGYLSRIELLDSQSDALVYLINKHAVSTVEFRYWGNEGVVLYSSAPRYYAAIDPIDRCSSTTKMVLYNSNTRHNPEQLSHNIIRTIQEICPGFYIDRKALEMWCSAIELEAGRREKIYQYVAAINNRMSVINYPFRSIRYPGWWLLLAGVIVIASLAISYPLVYAVMIHFRLFAILSSGKRP